MKWMLSKTVSQALTWHVNDVHRASLICTGRLTSVESVTLKTIAESTNCSRCIFDTAFWNSTVESTIRDHPLFLGLFLNCLLESRSNNLTSWNGCKRIMQTFNAKEYFMSLYS